MGRESVEPVAADSQSEESLDALVKLATASANWTERDARYLVDKIEQLEKAGTWPTRIGGQKDWGRFCREILGYEANYIEKIREGLEILEDRGDIKVTV